MKISTILLSGALLIGASASAQSTNLMQKANEGTNGDKGAMATNGWEAWTCPFTQNGDTYTFTSPTKETWGNDGPAGQNVRWENKSSDVTYENNAYSTPVAFIRWDNGNHHNLWYVYPVEITTPGTYEFSMLAGEWSGTAADSNGSYIKTDGSESAVLVAFSKTIGPEGITWGTATDADKDISILGTPAEGQGQIFTFTKTEANKATLQKCVAQFKAPDAGKYYVEFSGSHGITVMSDFKLEFKTGTGVEEIGETAEVVETVFFGLDGTRMAAPAKGSVVIEKSILSNGEVKVAKRLIR